MPLFVNAMRNLFPELGNYVNSELSSESFALKSNFSSVKKFNGRNHEIKILN